MQNIFAKWSYTGTYFNSPDNICLAVSIIESSPSAARASSKAAGTSGSMPNSICCIRASNEGLALKRTLQPIGSSLEKGNPEPPPVRSPMTVTRGISFILRTKVLAAL